MSVSWIEQNNLGNGLTSPIPDSFCVPCDLTVLECLQGSGARREIMFLKVNPGHLGRLGGSHELFVIQVVPVIRLGYVDTY